MVIFGRPNFRDELEHGDSENHISEVSFDFLTEVSLVFQIHSEFYLVFNGGPTVKNGHFRETQFSRRIGKRRFRIWTKKFQAHFSKYHVLEGDTPVTDTVTSETVGSNHREVRWSVSKP